MLDSAITARTQEVLDTLNAALAAGDVDSAKALFAAESYWRDLVSVTWNLKTVEGPDGVADMLSQQLEPTRPGNFHIQTGEIPAEEGGVITTWITFETKAGRSWGLIRLKDDRIWTLLTALQELKGFEENRGKRRPMGAEHGAQKNRATWKESCETEEAPLGYDTQPYTVIVGGGQGGIALGARLRQLGGECPELCVSGPVHAVSDTQASKRSPNIMANWLRAANHSRTFRPSFSKLRMAR